MRPSLLLTTAALVATTVAPSVGTAADGQASSAAASTLVAAPHARCAPKVNMEVTVKAAQIDPRRADDTKTPHARCSVLAVERALRAKHLLARRWVDGYFGTKTIAAYAGWQRSLGYRGLAANGLPGKTSLRKLGRGRFTVNHLIGPGRKVHRDGVVINTRTRAMLREAERRLGRRLVLTQGSYNPGGDPTSAGTHDGGGTVDISVHGMKPRARTAAARQLRKVGFAAWVRKPYQGDWPFHIHAVAINDTDLSLPAAHQVGDYYLGLNGLANRAPDDGPRIPIHTWEEYQRRH